MNRELIEKEDRITELWWQAKEANEETPADIPYDFAKLLEPQIRAECQERVEQIFETLLDLIEKSEAVTSPIIKVKMKNILIAYMKQEGIE